MFMQQPQADRLVQAAATALAAGRLTQAASLLDQAVRTDPHHPMALTKLAELAVLRKDHARALPLTAAALAVEPNFAPAWHQRAAACWLAGRQHDALHAARRAVDIQPPNPEFRLRLAQFAAWSGHGPEARDALGPLLAAERHDQTHYAAALSMLGELAIAEGRFDAANTFLDQALDLLPTLDVIRMLRGMNRLRLGQFRAGWADYAAREAISTLCPDGQPEVAAQTWQGQPLSGKTLLVTDDQGNGDAIQFFRYLPLLRNRGASHITWRTLPPLVRLFRAAAPCATVLDTLPRDARFDLQSNAASLPRWFETELHSIPATVPYLHPPSHRPATQRAKTAQSLAGQSQAGQSQAGQSQAGQSQAGQSQAGHSQAGHSQAGDSQAGHSQAGQSSGRRSQAPLPRVGLVWSGDARHTRDHLRSIPAELFLSLTEVPGISFHSLQHEVRAADLPALAARPAIARDVEKAVDLADTATLIATLDLVITVDTCVAHLTGALGKPVWILLHVAPDWRWLTERTNSPWYPTARLFRVTPTEWPGTAEGPNWNPVLGRVATALQAFAAA